MQSGKLRFKVEIQKPTTEVRRGIPATYEKVRDAWCSIKPIKSNESNSNSQLKAIGTYAITLWATSEEITEDYRIKHGDFFYNIISANVSDDLQHELNLVATRDKV